MARSLWLMSAQGFVKVAGRVQPGRRASNWSARRGSWALRRVSSVILVTPCSRNRVMTRLVRADITWGAFPVRMVDLSSCQTTSQPVQVLHCPVAAGVGEQAGGAGLAGVQAGDVQHGLAVAHDPAAVLLDRDVALQEDGLAGVREAQQGRQPAQRGRGRRLEGAGHRVAAGAMRGQHVRIPARRRPGDRQDAGVPARHPRDQHRHQRAQRVPDPARLARISQPGRQHLTQRRRRPPAWRQRRAGPPPGGSG